MEEPITQNTTRFYKISTHPAGEIVLGVQVKKVYKLNEEGEISYFEMEMRPFMLSVPSKLKHLYSAGHDVWTLQLSLNGISTYKPFCSSIYLHSDLQGIGIGTLFMNLMIKEGKILFKDHAIAIELERGTEDKEEKLKKFYERFGFTIGEKAENESFKGYADSFQLLNFVDEVTGINEEEGMSLIASQSERVEAYLWQQSKDKSAIENLGSLITYYKDLSDTHYIKIKRCVVVGLIGMVLTYVLH